MRAADDFGAALSRFLHQYQIPINNKGLEICVQHYTVLQKWNRVMNLVGDLSIDSAVQRHYGESIFLASQISSAKATVCDYGSGAGFPGMGFAALHPRWDVVLAEIREKRAVFLCEATRGNAKVSVHPGDVKDLRANLDWVCARAVDPDVLTQFALSRNLGLALLLSTIDAKRLEPVLGGAGFSVKLQELPWRKSSSVLLGSP